MKPYKTRIPTGLSGSRGLLLAVILTAANDVDAAGSQHREDARRYFASPDYDHHLMMLGLPEDMIPEFKK